MATYEQKTVYSVKDLFAPIPGLTDREQYFPGVPTPLPLPRNERTGEDVLGDRYLLGLETIVEGRRS